MVTKKSTRWIPLLMIISQLMLTGFVAYWLVSQYRGEKKTLQEDLARLYTETQNQLIDSLLMKRVVSPALRDSVSITMISNNQGDSAAWVGDKPHRASGYYMKYSPPKTANVTIRMEDTAAQKDQEGFSSIKVTNKKQDLLIRSVKLFISHTDDTTGSVTEGFSMFPGRTDTAQFRKIFQEKIDLKKYGVRMVWKNDSVTDSSQPELSHQNALKAIHISSHIPGNLPDLSIRNDVPYLLRQISPQILFGLILLLLSGSAFYFTNRSLKRQILLNSLRNDFVANITHELKTPVSTVKVAIEALKTFDKVKDPEKTKDYLDMAGQEMNRLDRLIGKVLDQSLIGEQKQIIHLRPTDLPDLVRFTLESLKPGIIERKATVNLTITDSPQPIMADPLLIQGVISNLVDNSLKYGTENPEITVTLREEGNRVCLDVADNGPGIPEPYLGRVFDKFFRVPNGDRHNIKGYGLGLSFASVVMDQHQGDITVRNLKSGGCAFTLRFPKTSA